MLNRIRTEGLSRAVSPNYAELNTLENRGVPYVESRNNRKMRNEAYLSPSF